MFCDLHMHSTASDGTTPPQDLPALAKKAGLAAIALTDHDTTDGLPACAQACNQVGIEFAPGIEISTDPKLDAATTDPPRGTLHILGYFIRHDDSQIAEISAEMKQARDERNPAIIAKLNGLGIDFTYDQVITLATEQGTNIIGRPHIAQLLVQHGHAKDMRDAFAKYLRLGAAAYVRRDRMPAQRAIDAIHHAQGLAVLAHPVQLGIDNNDQLDNFVAHLKNMGLNGLETRHCDHTPADTRRFENIAANLNLLTTGGSDFHGHRKSNAIADQRVPHAVFLDLLATGGGRDDTST